MKLNVLNVMINIYYINQHHNQLNFAYQNQILIMHYFKIV